jgi:hypothetical protein
MRQKLFRKGTLGMMPRDENRSAAKTFIGALRAAV